MADGVIDDKVFDELAQTTGAEFVVELVQVFFEEAPTMLAALRTAYAEGALEQFRRAAHSLKTNALTFGAAQLATQARALELDGLLASAAALDALDAAYQATVTALRTRAHG